MNIDKRSGRRFGPPTTKRLIAFLDDMNLPYVETYGTQNAIALLTQIVGYGTFFDRVDLGFRKEVNEAKMCLFRQTDALSPTAILASTMRVKAGTLYCACNFAVFVSVNIESPG